MNPRAEAVEMIRRICPPHLSADEYGQILAEKFDAYRTEVLRKAADRIRAIPIQCTALTGPVWYGEGWKDALTQLEEIADYQKPDDAAYPGELEMLRVLLLNLRVAVRKGDMDRAQQLIASYDTRAAEQRCLGCGEPLTNGEAHGLNNGYGGCV